MKVPLQAICFLERGKDNSIDLIPTKDALPLILKQTIFPKKQDTINHFFDMLDVVLTKTPIYQMKCNISKEAALMAYDKMKGE